MTSSSLHFDVHILISDMERIEAILFDWGGVLIDDPAPGLMAYCAEALGVPVEDYVAVHKRHGEPFQKGRIREAEFWQRVARDLGRPVPQVPSLWGQAFRAVYAPREEVFDLLDRLRHCGYKTALLSNTEAPAMELFHERHPGRLDALIFSCAEGTCKPERQIYAIAARKLETAPACCAVIDDRSVFVEGAVTGGMKGILYQDFEQVCHALHDLGVVVSPGR